jgi:ABC-type amino acid transport system permease subunit
LALAAAAIVSLGLAIITGILGAFAGMYRYDRGMSKGDDFVIAMSGLFAVGAFTFIVVFTWLRRLHHEISSRTPLIAWLICLAAAVATTGWPWDNNYQEFIVVGLAVILFCGLAGLVFCRRLLIRAPAAITGSAGTAPK